MASKCYTFYSYKGGSGRSTTLVNTVKHLINLLNVNDKRPVLVVDADLESAGLTYLFNCEKKFTRRFESTIHTERILTEVSDMLEGVTADGVFGHRRGSKKGCESLYSKLGKLYDGVNIAALFEGVELFLADFSILEKIVDAHYSVRTATSIDDCNADTKDLYRIYNLSSDLIAKLADISSDDTDNDSKLSKRQKTVEGFLPTRSFIDISTYFEAKPGSVQFLGVDLSNDDEHQIAHNGTARAIRKLLRECGNRGYQAVLFDCGSGVQSTAHVLHIVSDVLVYCMRPTQQFIRGTKTQLYNYRLELSNITHGKSDSTGTKKPVILLPTAVPPKDKNTEHLQNSSFSSIREIARNYSEIVDDTFCNEESCLKEVSLFKWREHILCTHDVNGDLPDVLNRYAEEQTMPQDAKDAYRVYAHLAQRLVENS